MTEASAEIASASGATACHRCQCAIEPGDLRCAVCGLPVPDEQQRTERPAARILRCENCGAAVSYTVEVQAPRCAFCDSVAHVEHPTDPVEQPRWIIPFQVSPEQAGQALKTWLSSLGFFRPSDLASSARLESLRPIWWVAWIFDARALISWTVDTNAGARRSQWAPHSGQNSMEFERILVSASRGLSQEETSNLTSFYDLTVADERFSGPPSALCEGFEVQRSAARQTISQAIETVARSRVTGAIPGTSFRNLKLAVLLEGLRTHRFALPTYVSAYRYRGKLYRALVNGQNPSCTFGTAPYSIAKIALVIGGAIGALLLVVLLLVLVSAVTG